MTMIKPGVLLALTSVLAFGCATQKYGYRPTSPTTTNESGFPASRYVIPPQQPLGEVYVTSFGTREMEQGEDARAQLLHVRLAVSNQASDSAWTIDPGQQTIVVAGGAAQRPDFMEVDGRANGETHVRRTERRVFDFFYRMPGGGNDARAVPSFDFQWNVDTGGGQVFAERTSFSREPYRDYGSANRQYIAVGVAPWWGWGYGLGWYGWPYYYGYGPYAGFGFGYRYGYHGGYYGPRYGGYGGGYGPRFGGGHGGGRIGAPSVRGRPR